MTTPENMDSTDLTPDGPTDEEVRASVRQWLDEHDAEFDAADFFEGYIDPDGPFRYSGSFDPWDAIHMLVDTDPHRMAEALREYITNAAFLLSMQGQDPAMAQMQGGPEQVAPTPAIAPEAIGVTPA